MTPRNSTKRSSLALFGFLVVCAASMAADTKGGKAQPIFYPPAPEQPRLQFLVSYTTDLDLGRKASRFARFVVGEEAASREIVKPYGLAFSKGKLHVCDVGRGGIDTLDPVNRTFVYWDSRAEREIRSPINLTIDSDGTRYVADRGRNQVLIFDTNSALISTIGKPSEPGRGEPRGEQASASARPKDMWPCDVALIRDQIYVADLNNNCVRVYNKTTHEQTGQIPQNRKDEESLLFAPISLAVDSKECLYVSDLGGFFVKKFDCTGKFLRKFGSSGDRPGEFVRPKGVAVDREGRLYVVDAGTQLVQIFDDQGRLLLFFGEPGGSDAPMDMPTRVIIDYDHASLYQKYAAPGFKLEYLVLVANQFGNKKVSVYGFGHRE